MVLIPLESEIKRLGNEGSYYILIPKSYIKNRIIDPEKKILGLQTEE